MFSAASRAGKELESSPVSAEDELYGEKRS
jgi:hypothetical protein